MKRYRFLWGCRQEKKRGAGCGKVRRKFIGAAFYIWKFSFADILEILDSLTSEVFIHEFSCGGMRFKNIREAAFQISYAATTPTVPILPSPPTTPIQKS